MIETAPLKSIVHFASTVGSDHNNRRVSRLHGAKFRYSHLEIGEHLQKKCFEGLVSPVDFIDQQDRRSRWIGFERLKQRSLD
jgi:hypothetical protein